MSTEHAPPSAAPAPAPDPVLVHGWAAGWAVSRRTAAPVAVDGGHRIEVGLPGHVRRYVLPSAEPSVLRVLAGTAAEPGVWLKVCAARERVAPLLGPGWLLKEPEFLMAAPLRARARAVPAGYRVEVGAADGAVDLRVLTTDGRPAATGRVGRAGTDAVFDQIVTEPEHRRRGLGSIVMNGLVTAVRELGAERGILVATADGLALYRTLGWELHSPVTAAVFDGTARPAA
ncbi:GNAT family N-acetyltransferase [Kitasatospora sp. NPDC004240]